MRMARQQTVPTRRQPRGERTKSAILRCAVDLASVEGMEGLSIGSLAEKLNMSKSGLFSHFGSKQELQLETIEAARQIFIGEIVRPALANPEGMLQLWALCDGWLSHVERRVCAGGGVVMAGCLVIATCESADCLLRSAVVRILCT